MSRYHNLAAALLGEGRGNHLGGLASEAVPPWARKTEKMSVFVAAGDTVVVVVVVVVG